MRFSNIFRLSRTLPHDGDGGIEPNEEDIDDGITYWRPPMPIPPPVSGNPKPPPLRRLLFLVLFADMIDANVVLFEAIIDASDWPWVDVDESGGLEDDNGGRRTCFLEDNEDGSGEAAHRSTCGGWGVMTLEQSSSSCWWSSPLSLICSLSTLRFKLTVAASIFFMVLLCYCFRVRGVDCVFAVCRLCERFFAARQTCPSILLLAAWCCCCIASQEREMPREEQTLNSWASWSQFFLAYKHQWNSNF